MVTGRIRHYKARQGLLHVHVHVHVHVHAHVRDPVSNSSSTKHALHLPQYQAFPVSTYTYMNAKYMYTCTVCSEIRNVLRPYASMYIAFIDNDQCCKSVLLYISCPTHAETEQA